MKQETKRLSSLIIAGLILVAAILVYFELIVPAYTSLEEIKGREESETILYNNAATIVTQGNDLLTKYQSDAASSQAIALALPVGQNVAGAIAQVYGIAANSNIAIQNLGISTQAVQTVAPTSNAGGSEIANAAAAGAVIKPTATITFQISGSGSYESIKSFLQGLETNMRIFNVMTMALQPAAVTATKTQPGNADMFNFTMMVVTYYQAS